MIALNFGAVQLRYLSEALPAWWLTLHYVTTTFGGAETPRGPVEGTEFALEASEESIIMHTSLNLYYIYYIMNLKTYQLYTPEDKPGICFRLTHQTLCRIGDMIWRI